MFIKFRGERQNFIQLLPHRKLSLEFLALFWSERFDINLVAPSEIQHHVTERVFAQLHQKLNRVATRAAAKAIVKLLAWTNAEAGRLVVMEGAEANKVFTLFPQHDMLRNYIDNVSSLLDLLNSVRMQPRNVHQRFAEK